MTSAPRGHEPGSTTLEAGSRPRVVIVGGGFAGYNAARSLARASGGAVDIELVSPTNYFLYLPLLPEVAGGVLDPRRISVSLSDTLPASVAHAQGEVDDLDLARQTVRWMDPEGSYHTTTYETGARRRERSGVGLDAQTVVPCSSARSMHPAGGPVPRGRVRAAARRTSAPTPPSSCGSRSTSRRREPPRKDIDNVVVHSVPAHSAGLGGVFRQGGAGPEVAVWRRTPYRPSARFAFAVRPRAGPRMGWRLPDPSWTRRQP